ncbi:hypothetical protein [Flavobacterium aquidurense]|uniref:Uncharacterized protein n=1 Tax=Flavobacterium aquidurense TaxID=362413 RepID=A0A0Q1BJL2_9FLAO|nr:hypothetical protein [Flavobacterium aquidurense]KQB40963.1 hypothetical protein RC62_4338 [Flavobacterium aquidurense]
MKFKALALLLIVLFFEVSCEKVPASIKLRIEFENKLNQDLSKIYGIQIYKDGKIFKKFSSFEKPYISKEITLDSLTNGTYEFVYENLVNQTLRKKIEVKENKSYEVLIYPDYSVYKDFIKRSFVRNLREDQKVEFYFESLGCFHSAKESLIITKKGKVYYAENKGQSKKLSKEQLDTIIKMECELELIKDGGCTTSDHYIIKSGKQEKEFYDETCKWNGWRNMSEQIKLN